MIVFPTSKTIQEAALLLREGGLIGLPTETVYGLAGDATLDQACARIFEKKGRPSFNPLIIHAHSWESFQGHVIWNEKADVLAKNFWPGSLTLVLPRDPSSSLSLLASAGLESLAVRVPNHPVALALLQSACRLLAAPSANMSGRTSPTHSHHVEEDFPDILIFEGGPAFVGLESTIIDLTGSVPLLLRPGGLAREDIEAVIGPVDIPLSPKISAPGLLKSHYAPRLPLRMNVENPLKEEAYLAFGPQFPQRARGLNLSQTGDLVEAASNFFKMMRLLDQPSFQGIAVAPIPLTGLGLALNDRLTRAAAPRAF